MANRNGHARQLGGGAALVILVALTAGAGPLEVFGVGGEAGSDGVSLDVGGGLPQVLVVEWSGEVAGLPDVAASATCGVAT